MIVFGVLKRQGKDYTEIVPDCSKVTLQGISVEMWHLMLQSILMDGVAYDGLVYFGFDKHYRIHHGENEFARGKSAY